MITENVSISAKSVKIGSAKIYPQVLAAPMAGFSNRASRQLNVEYGVGCPVTEMVSAKSIKENIRQSLGFLQVVGETTPFAVQLYGTHVEDFVRAAQLMEKYTNCLWIDLNMGCPMPKITKGGAGVALMEHPEHIRDLVRGVVDAVSLPVTVKFRLGPSEDKENYLEVGTISQECGASAVTLHPRWGTDKTYSIASDWSAIKKLKESVDIPVYGNGDIFEPYHAIKMLKKTGCDGVMVGRGFLGKPWLFQGIKALLEGEDYQVPDRRFIVATMKRHFELLLEYSPRPEVEYYRIRKLFPKYFTHFHDYEKYRDLLNRTKGPDEVFDILEKMAME
jgi:nifR3 family TIM-barrel protein